LQDVGTLAPEPEPVVQPPLPRKPSPLEDMGSVQSEMAERQTATATVEQRRQRLMAGRDD
jgi:hypothetical protein